MSNEKKEGTGSMRQVSLSPLAQSNDKEWMLLSSRCRRVGDAQASGLVL